MSATEIEEYGPPKDMSVQEWNEKRREEIKSTRRASPHRTLIDQVGGSGKVRVNELSPSNE